MNLDLRKLISAILLPAVLLSLSYFFLPQLSKPLPQVLQITLPYLPFTIFFTGMVLSWIFHHGREFNLFLLLAIIYISLSKYIWDADLKVDSQLAYLLLVSLVPINYLLNLLLRERGILNQYGIRRFVLLAIQLYCVAWILEHPYAPVKEALTLGYFKYSFLKLTGFSQPLIFAILVTGTFILFLLLKTQSILIAGTMSSFVAIITALHFYQQPQLSIIFILLSGFLILASIIINAYSLAYLDELTNLPSRRALVQTMPTLGKRYCIAMVDVDHFKKFNDKYGHDIGDQVLKKLASQLRQVRGGKAFRYGGEEFVLVFANKNLYEASLYCQQLCKNVADSPFILRDKKRPKTKNKNHAVKRVKLTPLKITISIGVAESSQELATTNDVIKQADKLLYTAKNNGRNQVAS